MRRFLCQARLLWAVGFFWMNPGHAQDARDEAIFGTSEPGTGTSTPAVQELRRNPLMDSLQIGGRLELRINSEQEEQQSFAKAGANQLHQADVYFDTRPDPHLRAFLQARLTEAYPDLSEAGLQLSLDQLWFKWDLQNIVFFTLGKQHLKWGSSRFWNPTDFTAEEILDPFSLFDRRLGQDLFKIHIPDEKRGYNYYAVFQYDQATRNDDIGLAFRGEFAFLGRGELALSLHKKRMQPIRLGLDISSALGLLDMSAEVAVSKGGNRQFYQGKVDPLTPSLPQAYTDNDTWFAQVVTALYKTWKYSDEDNLTVGFEFFYNELGYDERGLELYSLVMREARPLYAGRRYAALYILLPQPASWNETSFFLNVMRNVSDETNVLRLTGTWELFQNATLEVFASRCLGDFGELCFRLPEDFQKLADMPGIAPTQKQAILALPVKRKPFSAGLGLSMNF